MNIVPEIEAGGPRAHKFFVMRLISLLEDAERAGLRSEALLLAAMAYSVLDGCAAHISCTEFHDIADDPAGPASPH